MTPSARLQAPLVSDIVPPIPRCKSFLLLKAMCHLGAARSVEDCVAFMKALWVPKQFELDVAITPSVFRDALYTSPVAGMRIGMYTTDGFFEPAPACKRAVEVAAGVLRAAGAEVVLFSPPNVAEAVAVYYGIMSADGSMREYVEALDGEYLHANYRKLYALSRLPNCLRPVLGGVLRALGNSRAANVMEAATKKSAYDLFQYIVRMKLWNVSAPCWACAWLGSAAPVPGTLVLCVCVCVYVCVFLYLCLCRARR